jgi:hypothetical protein
LCRACYRRATARTQEEKNARLNAHLISALVALGLLVAALAVGLIDPARDMGAASVLMLIVLVIGYALPASILLNRSGRYLPTDDARYVRTTLLIPEGSQGLETAFEWRNQRSAEEFIRRTARAVRRGGIKDHPPSVWWLDLSSDPGAKHPEGLGASPLHVRRGGHSIAVEHDCAGRGTASPCPYKNAIASAPAVNHKGRASNRLTTIPRPDAITDRRRGEACPTTIGVAMAPWACFARTTDATTAFVAKSA